MCGWGVLGLKMNIIEAGHPEAAQRVKMNISGKSHPEAEPQLRELVNKNSQH
jgi:hypothetical protein